MAPSAGVASLPCSMRPGAHSWSVSHVTGRWHRGQRHGRDCPPSLSSSTPSSCWRATFAFVRTTPCLLGNRPTLHPIGKPGVAIVGFRRCNTPSPLVRATFAMNTAAPFLFGDRPACLPIRETISTIVWICRPRWRDRHHWRDGLHWWRDRLHWWQDDGPRRRRRCRRTAAMMNPTAPGFLVGFPSVLRIHCAIVWVNWPTWSSRSSWRWRGGRRGRRPWEGRRIDLNWESRQSRGRGCCRATPSHRHAAIIPLSLGPHQIIATVCASYCAIVRLRGAGARK